VRSCNKLHADEIDPRPGKPWEQRRLGPPGPTRITRRRYCHRRGLVKTRSKGDERAPIALALLGDLLERSHRAPTVGAERRRRDRAPAEEALEKIGAFVDDEPRTGRG